MADFFDKAPALWTDYGISLHYKQAAEREKNQKIIEDNRAWVEKYEKRLQLEKEQREAEVKKQEPYVKFNPEKQLPTGGSVSENKSGETRQNHSVVTEAKGEAHIAYLIPQTGEVILVPAKDYTKFRNHYSKWNKLIAEQHLANTFYQLCEEKLQEIEADSAKNGGKLSVEKTNAEEVWKSAAIAVNKANEALRKADYNDKVGLGTLEKIPENKKPIVSIKNARKELVELIPISTGGMESEPDAPFKKTKTFRWAGKNYDEWKKDYHGEELDKLASNFLNVVHSDVLLDGVNGKNSEKWPVFKDAGAAKWDDVFKADENGKRTLEKHLGKYIAEQLKDYKLNYFKRQILPEEAGHILEEKLLKWNLKKSYQKDGSGELFGVKYDFSNSAALMRYTYGATVSGDFQPLLGKVAFKAEGSGQFAIAEGKATAKIYAPKPDGWKLFFYVEKVVTNKDGSKTRKKIRIDLGELRFEFALKLEGLAGASIAAETSINIQMKNKEEPMVVGEPDVRPTNRPQIKETFLGNTPAAAAKAGIDAFAGLKAGGEISGALQWRNPDNKEKKFEDFARLCAEAHLMAGAGISAKFCVDYVEGKFRVSLAAGVCWGVGGKAGIGFEVGPGEIVSFLKWAYYQLYLADYTLLEYITDDGFKAWKYFTFLSIASPIGTAASVGGLVILDLLGREIIKLSEHVDKHVNTLKADMAVGKMRRDLAKSIKYFDKDVRFSPPETRGMLIYQMMQINEKAWKEVIAGNSTLNEERDAILTILLQVQTERDFHNSIQHIHQDGEKGSYDANYKRLTQFMNNGNYKGQIEEVLRIIRARLHTKPTLGYSLFQNDSTEYDLYRDSIHPLWRNNSSAC